MLMGLSSTMRMCGLCGARSEGEMDVGSVGGDRGDREAALCSADTVRRPFWLFDLGVVVTDV